MLDRIFVPVNRAGWPFIGGFACGALLLWILNDFLGLVGFVLTLWCIYFFRDPDRVTPTRSGLIVAPADGYVQKVDHAPPPPELEMGPDARARVCIFMNVFDVHVNRAPTDGMIQRIAYRPGKFFNASLDKASDDNERNAFRMILDDGTNDLAFVQIAGLVARRIVCQVSEGQPVAAGQRIGLIRFGSRVDVYLPIGVVPLVVEGQTAIAGETVIADPEAKEQARAGQIR